MQKLNTNHCTSFIKLRNKSVLRQALKLNLQHLLALKYTRALKIKSDENTNP